MRQVAINNSTCGIFLSMKIFNGRVATEEYMSTHSLTFSTPEMTLKKFALWLGEQITNSENKQIPRLFSFVEDKAELSKESSPDIDESFSPSGAVTDMYSTNKVPSSGNTKAIENSLFCIECGALLKTDSKFCRICGTKS